jgi:hypothetical protein
VLSHNEVKDYDLQAFLRGADAYTPVAELVFG